MLNKPTSQQLTAENENLRTRLSEATETLRAIRSGEVDALFISDVGGGHLFTLKGADQSYRILIEEMGEGALTVTAQGVILYANRRFAEMIKMPLEKVIGAMIDSWLAPDSQPIFQALLNSGVTEKRREQLDLIVSDGTAVPVLLSLSNVHSKDMPDFFCLVATDLTEQKRSEAIILSAKSTRELLAAANQSRRALLSLIEDQKQAEMKLVAQYEHVKETNAQLVETNQKLEQAQSQLLQSEKMAAIGLLAAGVAHEINNPLGYVNSNIGTLEKYLAHFFFIMDKYAAAEALMVADNPLFQELHQYKAKINLDRIRNDTKALIAESQQGLERVKKIILDLKEFSHADSEDQWAWADVHQILDATLNVVWNELKYKCEVVKKYGALPKIYCLPSQLNQVFMNLLVNAGQAIEVRGTITLRTGQQADMIWVEVLDTGKGIQPKNIPRLFEPFFTTKPVSQGTGLGLWVSYTIIEKHHGKIEVHSELGKGSTFRVWLPVQQPDSKETT